MVDLLTWDSEFFGRKMGVVTGPLSRASVAQAITIATSEAYEYLVCRPSVDDAAAIHALERGGFYLTDVGVTWSSPAKAYLDRADVIPSSIRAATPADVPMLSAAAQTLFHNSRFYHDPFFSVDDANRLHAAWLANSVSGQAADAVLIDPDIGFVTCKLTKDGCGEVGLIGVWAGSRGRGAGRNLMTAAVRWFADRGIATIRVKTQVKNLVAMNFYHRLRFDLHAMDMTLSCILAAIPREGGA